MIILIGTSHIAPESLKNIRKAIEREKPDCVAVELDRMRYAALKSKKGNKPTGLFLRMLSWIQKELGKMTGISPGEEMMEAVRYSQKKKIKTYLIDQDFSVTVRDISRISVLEKFKLFFMAVFSGFSGRKIDLKKVPAKNIVKEALDYLKKHFPQMHRTIVVKRNIYMSQAIKGLSKEYKKILVVVGAGHIEGLKKLLKSENLKIIG
ncbi:MAG: TraB/GumN family protein [archaeon]|nr:MAG: TraB/GumN family protein [archaeon]